MSASEELITLRSGAVVAVEALRLLWSLEDRGARVRLDGDAIVISPRKASPTRTARRSSAGALKSWRY